MRLPIVVTSIVYLLCVHIVLIVAIFRRSWLRAAYDWTTGTGGTWEPTEDWWSIVADHACIDATAGGSVLVFGDSLVLGLNVNKLGQDGVNYGIGGDTIEAVALRLPLYRSLQRARAIVLAIGINDLFTGDAATAAARYEGLVAKIPSHVPLVLSAVLPVDEARLQPPGRRRNDEIRRLNMAIAGICARRRGCVMADAAADLANAHGNLRVEFHRGDGLHLSPAGYGPWIAALQAALARVPALQRDDGR